MRALSSILLPVAVAAAAQPLALHPENPHYFRFRGKPTVLITSGEHYGAVLNADFDYVAYLDTLAADGLNHTRLFAGTYREVPASFGITDNTLAPLPHRYLAPWARSGTDKFDLNRWDGAYFARLKDFIAQAGKRGIVVEVNLFCPFYKDELWQANPMNAANNVNGIGRCGREEVYTLKHADLLAVHDAVTRKIVAELQDFDNLYYEVCNEPYFGGVTRDWQDHIVATIIAVDDKHLISMNIANGRAKIEKPNPAVSIFNFHYCHPPDTVAMNYHLNKVIGENETGFRGKAGVLYRTEAWDFILAGGALYNNLDYSFTRSHPRGDFLDYKSPGGGSPALRKQLKILKDFIERFDFIHMQPSHAVVTGGQITAPLEGQPAAVKATVRVLAAEGKAYALYVHGGTQATLAIQLPAGRYRAEWVNTHTGAVDKSETLDHNAGTATLVAPSYTEDIALRVVKAATSP